MNHDTHKVRFGLRAKMIVFTIIPLIIVLFIIGAVLLLRVSDAVGALKRSEIDSQTQAVASIIDDYFHPFLVSTELAVNLDCIQEMFAEITQSSKDFDMRNAANYDEVLEEMKEIADAQAEGMITLWITAESNNQLLHSNGNTTDESFVLATRPWYQQLLANNGNMIVTSAYEDVVSGEMVISCATGVFKPGTDKVIGAVGMDISLDSLIKQIGSMVIGEAGYITAYDCDDVVLYHPDSNLILKNRTEIGYSENMHNILSQHQTTTTTQFTRDGNVYHGSVVHIEDIGWNIIGTVTIDEFRSENSVIALITITSFILCAIVLSGITVVMA
ncbi:MAG: cache domain-containing protein, partial [Oscillospiraceae bacterium]|nr:cache domain-containing protein [Oscillospiraceae bacterium]